MKPGFFAGRLYSKFIFKKNRSHRIFCGQIAVQDLFRQTGNMNSDPLTAFQPCLLPRLYLKLQVPSTKLQTNYKFQYPMNKTFENEPLF